MGERLSPRGRLSQLGRLLLDIKEGEDSSGQWDPWLVTQSLEILARTFH